MFSFIHQQMESGVWLNGRALAWREFPQCFQHCENKTKMYEPTTIPPVPQHSAVGKAQNA